MIFFLLQHDNSAVYAESQDALMRHFFSTITAGRRESITNGDPSSKVCLYHDTSTWEGIQCKRGMVVGIRFQQDPFGNVGIVYAPPSVRWLAITDCYQHYALNTRMLPRDSLSVNLHSNKIYGSLNVNTLPKKLEWFSVMDNQMTGSLTFLHLPETLKNLNVSKNYFHATFVYANLPTNITGIYLGLKSTDKENITLKPLTKHDKSPNEVHIFHVSEYQSGLFE